jgi:hypothetical protein
MKLTEAWIIAVILAILGFPVASQACSYSCIDSMETRRNFVVRVTYKGKALPGVHVEVTTLGDEENRVAFSGTTGGDGTVRVANLPPGKFDVDAEFLGIDAGYQCFHVSSRSSSKAQKRLSYTWGDSAPAVRQISGQLSNSQPNPSGDPISRLTHRVDVPIGGAKLRLQGPLNATVYSAVTDADGNFSFDAIPEGTYVFHVDAATKPDGISYLSVDELVLVSKTAKADRFLLTIGAAVCGNSSIQLQESQQRWDPAD